jgi:hypothetical protein
MNKKFEKLLSILLRKKFPSIIDVKVIANDMDEMINYNIYIGITPDELMKIDDNEVKTYTRDLFKTIADPNEKIYQLAFYNPLD